MMFKAEKWSLSNNTVRIVIGIFVLSLAVVFVGGKNNISYAESPVIITHYESQDWEKASAGDIVTKNFDVGEEWGYDAYLFVPKPISIIVTTTTPETVGETNEILESDELWNLGKDGDYFFDFSAMAPAGNYTLSFKFNEETTYKLYIGYDESGSHNPYQEGVLEEPAINKTMLGLGLQETAVLKVSNAAGDVIWKSSNTKVATVSEAGVVTGIQNGSCKITAIAKDSFGAEYSFSCKVTVSKNNQYIDSNGKKAYSDGFDDGFCYVYVTKAAYDSKGNLALKLKCLNKDSSTVKAIKNLKISIKTSNGKTIGTATVKSKKINLKKNKTLDFKTTIKKANVKIKKADLRNAKANCKFGYTS